MTRKSLFVGVFFSVGLLLFAAGVSGLAFRASELSADSSQQGTFATLVWTDVIEGALVLGVAAAVKMQAKSWHIALMSAGCIAALLAIADALIHLSLISTF